MNASSLKGVTKTRTYRERGQLESRKRLGLLEKHKDYVKRARDYHSKQKKLAGLREKASQRNPDEFYFAMENSQVKDGRHVKDNNGRKYTDEELKLMKSQDIDYIQLKISSEKSKLEKESFTSPELFKTDNIISNNNNNDNNNNNKVGGKHTVFVDSKKEKDNFKVEEYFDTHPDLVGRKFNRPTMEQLKSNNFVANNADLKEISKQRTANYHENQQRSTRLQKLQAIHKEMELKQNLTKKGKRVYAGKGSDGISIYKWKNERKR